MRRNFFEVIGMADVERVHSQMLAWIFEADVLTAEQKSEILTELTGQAGEYAVAEVSTEHNHIDILIETESSIIAIENKIKIAEHDEQLTRYQQALEQTELPRRFIYLSLRPEVLTNPNWIARTYGELHSALLHHQFASPSSFDEHAFNEYVHAVGNLANVLAAFDQDHSRFPNVFTDGSRTKRDKHVLASKYTDQQNYVRENQLETVLQRHFLARIRSRVVPSSAKSSIGETHGVAFLQVVIASRLIRGETFDWAVQFQAKTAKLNCLARDYAKSGRDQLPTEVMKDFEELAEAQDTLDLNRPRTKAYVSLSKRLDFDWSDTFERIARKYEDAYVDLSRLGISVATAHGTKAR
jgi:hypothetical protein